MPRPQSNDDHRVARDLIGRRRFLQVGGFSVATAAVVAACGGTDGGGLARVGFAATTTVLPEGQVNDAVLLRTASSVERSVVSVYDRVIGDSTYLDPSNDELARRCRDDHIAHADLFEQLTADIGAEPWACTNPRMDEFVIEPVFTAIDGAPATEDSPEVQPTDDPQRDVLSFVHALEAMLAASYQSMVTTLSQGSLRKESIIAGTHDVRHAALWALTITGRPEGYVPPVEEGDPTEFPPVYAIPSTFGSLAAQEIVIGAPNESGVRTTFTIDTPSLNTYVYEYMTPGC